MVQRVLILAITEITRLRKVTSWQATILFIGSFVGALD
nr:MAG TPA: hypothetical protein [Caudoviricetes sp.]